MTQTRTEAELPAAIREFLDHDHFATISTIDPDGAPRQAVIWYTLDGDELVLNSALGRRWPTNLLRDPRLSMAVHDSTDGYRWVGLTGTAVPITDQAIAQADIAAMARRYHADEPGKAESLISDRYQRMERISFRFRPQAFHDHLE